MESYALNDLSLSISRAQQLLLSQQYPDGFWWYTLEANETIGSEFILLLYSLNLQERYKVLIEKLIQRMLTQQRTDGSWALYYEGHGDLSTTIECYWILKLHRQPAYETALEKAKTFILSQGGLLKARIFTKIHLAQFGLFPWRGCPELPSILMLLPANSPFSIYQFSSWARACIVPLLILFHFKKTILLKDFDLEELYLEPFADRDFSIKNSSDRFFSLENFFIQVDRFLKAKPQWLTLRKLNQKAIQKAEAWIIEHVQKTEDIYPALAYSILALSHLGRSTDDPILQKCFKALLYFQQNTQNTLPAIPTPAHGKLYFPKPEQCLSPEDASAIHQQCCVSPVWDTPWVSSALLESDTAPDHPALIRAAEWLLSKQITETYGDWAIKNKKALPGGWSFEFENEYFPDVDDTLQILSVLNQVKLPEHQVKQAFERGLQWLLSMQSKNGGWAAFDIDNTREWVNRIPFSDHAACLDPPTPDITARILELLGNLGYSADEARCQKALRFLWSRQEKNGSWWGRWGVNYIYGTWCVLQGLHAMKIAPTEPAIQKAVQWLQSIQNEDGGWGESCASYTEEQYVALGKSTASQTAWALMGLMTTGESSSPAVQQGIQFLIKSQNSAGGWDEPHYTGTGFPEHFYIRYHGYRHYFPLLALGKFRRLLREVSQSSR